MLRMQDDDIIHASSVQRLNARGTAQRKSGIAVLNETFLPITVGLSMGGTHYWENDLARERFFYRRPGAVWYTVYCAVSTDETRLSTGKCAKSIVKVALPAVFGAAAIVATGGLLGPALVGAATSAVAVETAVATAVTSLGVEGLLAAGAGLSVSIGSTTTAFVLANTKPAEGQVSSNTESHFEVEEFLAACRNSKLYAQKRGCYAGLSGTWLALRGGPYVRHPDENWQPSDFQLVEVGQDYVCQVGELSSESGSHW